MIIDNPEKAHIPALRRLWQQAFGDSEGFLDSFFATGFSYDRCRCVFMDGQPVAAHYLFDCLWQGKKVCYLYALAVEESHRGKGYSRLLMTDTQAKLTLAGYAGIVLEPADEPLRAYYRKLGYRDFGGRAVLTVPAGSTPIPLQQLGQLGYEQARRKHLPAGGILQEGAMTAFLQTQAVCYGGEDFAAAVSGSMITEFLGDREKLPGLVKALALQQAQVRVPGDQPAAMYLSLTREQTLPGYFGIPMD